VYALLDDVEQVKSVAEQLPALIASRKYLTATEQVNSSLATLDKELCDVDALQQVMCKPHLRRFTADVMCVAVVLVI